MNVAQESIIVNAPVAEVYERWLRFEDLPKFIKPLRDVQRINDTHFSFTTGDEGVEHRGILEVMFRKSRAANRLEDGFRRRWSGGCLIRTANERLDRNHIEAALSI